MARATHTVWDNLVERDVPICEFHADLIEDGRAGRRFDASMPIRLDEVAGSMVRRQLNCSFDCHKTGCHGAVKDEPSGEIHAD